MYVLNLYNLKKTHGLFIILIVYRYIHKYYRILVELHHIDGKLLSTKRSKTLIIYESIILNLVLLYISQMCSSCI